MAYADEVLADNPVIYLRLGEPSGTTAEDAGPNNLDGTYVNAPTLGVAGALTEIGETDTAVTFNGTDECVTVADNALLDILGDLSIEAWVKPTDRLAQYAIVSKRPSASFNCPYEVYITTTGALQLFYTDAGAVDNPVTQADVVPVGQWSHVVVTRDAGVEHRVYVNDSLVLSGQVPIVTPTGNSNTMSVGRTDSGSRFFKGSIDEVALYSSVLSPSRVSAHLDAGVQSSIVPIQDITAILASKGASC